MQILLWWDTSFSRIEGAVNSEINWSIFGYYFFKPVLYAAINERLFVLVITAGCCGKLNSGKRDERERVDGKCARF